MRVVPLSAAMVELTLRPRSADVAPEHYDQDVQHHDARGAILARSS